MFLLPKSIKKPAKFSSSLAKIYKNQYNSHNAYIIIMLIEKQKNIISYQLYAARKNREPDYLCNVIKKYKHIEKVQAVETDPNYEETIRRKMNEKRIQEIKRNHKYNSKISSPQPYIKRTWVSPVETQQKKQEIVFSYYRKNIDSSLATINTQEKQKTKKIWSILDMNKKMHCFGQYMYSQFEQKQNGRKLKMRNRDKKMDLMHKQYCRLMNSIKKGIVICNKNSELNKKIFANPLFQDKYYQKIIRKKDEDLSILLIESLMISGNFTFTSYIQFYELFVWQQATKQAQIQFVIKILMGINSEISYKKLSEVIDLMCSKINLIEHKQSLNGFNEVMKKLIFGAKYEICSSPNHTITRQELAQSLEINEECISIFINVFYSQ